MNQDNTICHKVDQILDLITDGMRTHIMDAPEMARLLHEIRVSATNMEQGLKQRKKIMVENKLEKDYQESKGKFSMPQSGINKIIDITEKSGEVEEMEVRIMRKGEVVYENKVKAGVFSFVENITSIDQDGSVDGTTQKLSFGHPLAIFFAFDQLRQAIEHHIMSVVAELKTLEKDGKFNNETTEKLTKILKTANLE